MKVAKMNRFKWAIASLIGLDVVIMNYQYQIANLKEQLMFEKMKY